MSKIVAKEGVKELSSETSSDMNVNKKTMNSVIAGQKTTDGRKEDRSQRQKK